MLIIREFFNLSRMRMLLFIPLMLGSMVCAEPEADINVTKTVSLVSEVRLKNHVAELCQRYWKSSDESVAGSLEELNKVRASKLKYIRKQLEGLGYTFHTENFDIKYSKKQTLKVSGTNLYATKLGVSDSIIEIGAHYDTEKDTPGADDNCSGVAAVIELAHVLSKQKLEKTVRFCFYDFEEWGLIGSKHHVKQIQKTKEKVEVAYVFDMIGFTSEEPNSQRSPMRVKFVFDPPTTANFLALLTDQRSANDAIHFESAKKSYVPKLKLYNIKGIAASIPDAKRSDHAPYWEAGIRALFITDTGNFRYKHYHKPTDTPEKLNYTFLTQVVKATCAAVMEQSKLKLDKVK